MRSLKILLWCVLCIISKSKALQSDLIHFGASPEETKQAAYYLAVDSGYNTGPSDELRRTQRSFWKKLFKNGLFGDDCDNCCNNCQYNVGDGNGGSNGGYNALPGLGYNPLPGLGNRISLPNWQPFQPLQTWQPFQPLFRGNCGNRCGGGGGGGYNQYAPQSNNDNYGNNPSPPGGYTNNYGSDNYGDGGNSNAPDNYGSDVNPASESYSKPNEPVYDAPEPSPPAADTSNYAENSSEEYAKPTYEKPADTTYEKPADYSNNAPAQTSSYSNDDSSSSSYADNAKTDYSNTKIPQILYQPIIYVSPQYLQQAANKLAQGANGYVSDSKGTQLPHLDNYAAETPVQTQYNSPAVNAPGGYTVTPYNGPVNQIPTTVPACSQSYSPCAQTAPSYAAGAGGGPSSVSTVSTVYTVVSPPLLNSASVASPPPCSNSGPSKYSLYPSSSIPLQGYSENQTPSLPAPGPAYGPTAYTTPILTFDDQPYRTCPELFTEYNRQHNNISPYSQANSVSPSQAGNTFVNSQFISY